MADDMKMPVLHLQQNRDGHEERLQRLETGQSELGAEVARAAVSIAHLTTEVEKATDKIAEKIDACVTPLADKIVDAHRRLAVMDEAVSEQSTALALIQAANARREARWDSWKKFITAVTVGACAIGAKELVVYLAHRPG